MMVMIQGAPEIYNCWNDNFIKYIQIKLCYTGFYMWWDTKMALHYSHDTIKGKQTALTHSMGYPLFDKEK